MYPVGTKCVITWASPMYLVKNKIPVLGTIVTCSEPSPPVVDPDNWTQGAVCQWVLWTNDTHGHWPVDWMKPLEDPDTSIMEDAEAIKRLADEILS